MFLSAALEENNLYVMTKVSLTLIGKSSSTDDIKAYFHFLPLRTFLETLKINRKWTTYRCMDRKHEWLPDISDLWDF